MARPMSAPRFRPPLGSQVSRCESDPIYTVATEELEEVAWNVFPRKQMGLELRTKMAFACGLRMKESKGSGTWPTECDVAGSAWLPPLGCCPGCSPQGSDLFPPLLSILQETQRPLDPVRVSELSWGI